MREGHAVAMPNVDERHTSDLGLSENDPGGGGRVSLSHTSDLGLAENDPGWEARAGESRRGQAKAGVGR